MQLGWIDFSKEERNKIMQTLKLLEESTAVDELGIGVIRDGYSDILFPGITTLQTRAKYFVLIPYIFTEAEKESFKRSTEVLQWINKKEDMLVRTLVKNSDADAKGIIGSQLYKQGKSVKLKPSSIYWNGLKTFEIIKDKNLSVGNVCDIVFGKSTRRRAITIKKEGETYDDETAVNENIVVFSPIHLDYSMENDTNIELTKLEASYLSEKITTASGSRNSLLAYMLNKHLIFPSFDKIDYIDLPDVIKYHYCLAKSFADFIRGAHIRYNVIFSNGKDIEQVKAYYDWVKNFHFDGFNLSRVLSPVSSNDQETNTFLNTFYDASKKGDLEAVDRLIIGREKRIKQDRAKLRKPQEYFYDQPVHDYNLDYRYSTAFYIIKDIFRGLEVRDG